MAKKVRPKRPKSKVVTKFQPAQTTPSLRIKARPAPPREPNGVSPLTKYIEENEDSGLPVRELIEQFQEYDCDHPQSARRIVAQGSTYQFIQCGVCQKVEKKLKPGENDG